MKEYAEQLITQSIKENKLLASQNRRDMVRKYLDYFSGDNTIQYIERRFNSAAFQEVPPACFNITRRFIDRMSRIYTLGAVRNVKGQYQDLTYLKNLKMKHLEKMTRLIGTLATRVSFRADPEPHFNYIPIYYFDCSFGDDPYNPVAITYPMLQPVYDASKSQELSYCYWDAEHYIVYSEHGDIKEEIQHGYGVLPFVFTHRDNQLDEFFVGGAYDVVSCNELMNILFTEANLGMRFQMFGQYAITGMYSDENISRAGSDEIMVVPEGVDVEILSPKGNLDSAMGLIRQMLDLTAQNNHLYVSFEENGADRPSSGIALKIKDLERFEDYQDDLELWTIYEKEIFKIEKAVAGANGVNIPGDLAIDFNEPEYPMTVADQIQIDEFHLSHNLTTEAGLMVKYNNDLSIEEAKAVIEKNKESNGQGKQEQAKRPLFNQLRNQTPSA